MYIQCVVPDHASWAKHSGRNLLLSRTSCGRCSSHTAVVYSMHFGRRTASVLGVFVLPQSKALTWIFSLSCLVLLLRWRKALASELSSSYLMKPPALWCYLDEWPKADTMAGVCRVFEVTTPTSWCPVFLLLRCRYLPPSWGFAVISPCLFCLISHFNMNDGPYTEAVISSWRPCGLSNAMARLKSQLGSFLKEHNL